MFGRLGILLTCRSATRAARSFWDMVGLIPSVVFPANMGSGTWRFPVMVRATLPMGPTVMFSPSHSRFLAREIRGSQVYVSGSLGGRSASHKLIAARAGTRLPPRPAEQSSDTHTAGGSARETPPPGPGCRPPGAGLSPPQMARRALGPGIMSTSVANLRGFSKGVLTSSIIRGASSLSSVESGGYRGPAPPSHL